MNRGLPHPIANDRALAPLIRRHGVLEIETASDPFRRLVTSIVNQQLSTASAAAIRQRLFDRFEIRPAALLGTDPSELREVGLSARKADYLLNIAEAFREDPDLSSLEEMSDEDVTERLTAITGVGTWTAKIFLIFALGRPDVFPVEDLGIRKGMRELFGDLSRAGMVERAERWRPHRSLASLYVWRAKREAGG